MCDAIELGVDGGTRNDPQRQTFRIRNASFVIRTTVRVRTRRGYERHDVAVTAAQQLCELLGDRVAPPPAPSAYNAPGLFRQYWSHS